MKIVRNVLVGLGLLALALVVSSIAIYLAFLILVFGLFYSWVYPTVFGLIVGLVAIAIGRRLSRRFKAFEIDTTITKVNQ